jgi:hypothetical protein
MTDSILKADDARPTTKPEIQPLYYTSTATSALPSIASRPTPKHEDMVKSLLP